MARAAGRSHDIGSYRTTAPPRCHRSRRCNDSFAAFEARNDGRRIQGSHCRGVGAPPLRLLLVVTAVCEGAMGLLLPLAPAFVLALLFGWREIGPETALMGRVAGAAVLGLSVAGWLAREHGGSRAQRGLLSGLLVYNVAAVVRLSFAGTVLNMVGLLLRPAVLHHPALTGWGVSWARCSPEASPRQRSDLLQETLLMETMASHSGTMRWLRLFEPLMLFTGIAQPLGTLPQIAKLYITHSHHASGQSLATWCIFLCATSLWVVYGLLNRKPAIYVGNIIGVVMNLLMVIGILTHAGITF